MATVWLAGESDGLALSHSTLNSALFNSCTKAFCQFLIFHFGILSILFILSQFPAGTAIKTLDRMNTIYRIKPFGNGLERYVRVLRLNSSRSAPKFSSRPVSMPVAVR